MNKKICIGVLHHNNPKLILRFLEAIYRHTENFYLLILDNKSTDNSIDIIRKFLEDKSGYELFLGTSNLGVIGGRNALFNHFHKSLNYDNFLILDNDQIVQDGWQDQYMNFRKSGK